MQQFLAADLIPDYDQPGYFKTAAVTFSCTGSDTDFIAMLDDLAAGYPSVQLQTFTISTRSYANPDGTSEEGSVYTVSLNVILCDKGRGAAVKNIRLGDLLIELGYITPDQLTAALAYQKEHRDLRVGQALQELGYVNERQVLEALAKRLQIQLIDIEHTTVDVTAVEKVPQELAQKYDMLPMRRAPAP